MVFEVPFWGKLHDKVEHAIHIFQGQEVDDVWVPKLLHQLQFALDLVYVAYVSEHPRVNNLYRCKVCDTFYPACSMCERPVKLKATPFLKPFQRTG